jgi:hypothetical protein
MLARSFDVRDKEASALIFLKPSPGNKRAYNKREEDYGDYENNGCHEAAFTVN